MGNQLKSRRFELRRVLAPLVGLTAVLGASGLAIGVSPASAIPVTCSLSAGSNPVTNGSNLQGDLTDPSCGTILVSQGTYQGQFSPNHDVTVTGAAQATTILNGAGGGTVFTSDHIVTLNKLTITGGANASSGSAGGVANTGTMTLNQDNVTLNQDSAGGGTSGGGVFNEGTMLITGNTSISRNLATGTDCNGGVFNHGPSPTMTITGNSIITGNTCTGLHGTGGIGNDSCATLLIYNSSITNNTSPDAGEGGGMWSDGYLYMSGDAVTGNTAGSIAHGGAGGGLFVTTQFAVPCARDGVATIMGGLFANDSALDQPGFGGEGGAIYLQDAATLTMSGSGGVANNFASECGGGIYVQNGAGGSLNGTTIQKNFAGVDGGGVFDEVFALNYTHVNFNSNNPDNDDGGGLC